MAAFNKFEDFVRAVCEGEHVLSTAGCTLKAYLSNTAPNTATHAVKADLAEITNQNGYTAPVDLENTGSEASGTYTIALVDKVIEASGGTVGPFQYAVVYNDTHASDGLVGWYDYLSPITLQAGEKFTLDSGATFITIGFSA